MNRFRFFWLFVIILIVACTPTSGDPTATLVIPTAIEPLSEAPSATPSPTPMASPTLPPAIVIEPSATAVPATATRTPLPPTHTPTPQPDLPRTYQVSFVAADDELNVRSQPGIDFDVTGQLPANASDVVITGPGQMVAGSTWVPVQWEEVEGWVNGRFLTTHLTNPQFCQNAPYTDLLVKLQDALVEQDSTILTQIVHPERGLRLRHNWWNPEVRLDQETVQTIFTADQDYDWGTQDGSGLPLTGPFNTIMLPKLEADLITATDFACNEILHGGTAGLIQLPDEYARINFVSFYRPGSEAYAGMDWGSWVVGIEEWEGALYLSFLVHFEWEI